MFSALATQGDFQNKINLFIAISPIANLNFAQGSAWIVGSTSLFEATMMLKPFFKVLEIALGMSEIFGPKWDYYKSLIGEFIPSVNK
jgi:hypothetical protein